jgi:hypothetical protein
MLLFVTCKNYSVKTWENCLNLRSYLDPLQPQQMVCPAKIWSVHCTSHNYINSISWPCQPTLLSVWLPCGDVACRPHRPTLCSAWPSRSNHWPHGGHEWRSCQGGSGGPLPVGNGTCPPTVCPRPVSSARRRAGNGRWRPVEPSLQ